MAIFKLMTCLVKISSGFVILIKPAKKCQTIPKSKAMFINLAGDNRDLWTNANIINQFLQLAHFCR